MTVEAGEVGDVITRDAMAVRRLPAFTVTRVLCNACTASPSGYIDRIELNYDFLAAQCTSNQIEMKHLESYHHYMEHPSGQVSYM